MMGNSVKTLITPGVSRRGYNGPPTFMMGEVPTVGVPAPGLARHTREVTKAITTVTRQSPDNLGQKVSLFVRHWDALPHRGKTMAEALKRFKNTLVLNTK